MIERFRRREPVYETGWIEKAVSSATASAEVVIKLVLEAVPARRVIDVGCGLGAWLAEFRRQGIAETLGVDGPWFDPGALLIPTSSFLVAEVGKPLPVEETYDLAVSLEVGEHLDSSLADGLVSSLTHLAPVVLFSAAIPGQFGKHHVNLQWQDYWARLFAERGFVAVDYLRPRIWTNDSVRFFYRQNVVLYVERGRLADYPALEACHRVTSGTLLPLVHPVQYDAVRSRPLLLIRDELLARVRKRNVSRAGRA